MMNTHDIEGILKEIEHLSDKDKVTYLFEIIDQEKDKPWNQINFQKIEECSRYIEQLTESELPDEMFERIRMKNDAKIKTVCRPVPKKRKLVKRIIGIAAAVTILFCTATITVSAYAEGMSIGEYIVYAAKNLFPGESIEQNGITFIHEDTIIVYDDIETLIDREKLDIFYPSKLPKNIHIEEIVLTGYLTGVEESKLIFVFNTSNIFLSISNNPTVDLDASTFSTYNTKVGVFCIIEKDGIYQAICQTDRYEYTLSTNDNSILKIILEGLKKS